MAASARRSRIMKQYYHHRVLIAEDDASVRDYIAWSFRRAFGPLASITAVPDGQEAIRYMTGGGGYSDRVGHPFPSLVLLDLSMPRADGFEVLGFMAMNPAWYVIPKIVFGGSEDEDDIKRAYMLGATVYHRKPLGLGELRRTVERIVQYWKLGGVPPIDRSGRLHIADSKGEVGGDIPEPEFDL